MVKDEILKVRKWVPGYYKTIFMKNGLEVPNPDEETVFKVKGKTFYKTRRDAEERRSKGDRIYFVAGVGYYLVRKKKNGFWF